MAYTFKIIADTSGAVSGLNKVKAAVQGINNEVGRTHESMGMMERHLRRIGEYMIARWAFQGIHRFAEGIIDTTAKFEALTNVIKYSSLSPKDAAENIKFVTDLVKKLHLPLQETYEGFSNMQAGMVGTGIQGDKMRKIFEALATANSVLHLAPNTMNRIFYDTKVMAEMTTIQKRELGRMLARVVPGTMGLAAKAEGTSIEGLLEKMKEGMIKSKDFLPKFAAQMQAYYEGGLKYSTKSLVANMNDFKTAITNIQLQLGNRLKPMLLEILQTVVQIGQKFVDWLGTADGEKFYQTIYDIWQTIKWIVKEFINFKEEIKIIIELWIAWKAIDLIGGWAIGLKSFITLLKVDAVAALTEVGAAALLTGLKVASIGTAILLLADLIERLRTIVSGETPHEKELVIKYRKAKQEEDLFKNTLDKGYSDNAKGPLLEHYKKLKQATVDAKNAYEWFGDLSFGGVSTRLGYYADMIKKSMGLDYKPLPKPSDDNPGGAGAGFFGNGGGDSDAAMNMSNLSGANGGLGQAKVLNLYFNKALIENNIPGGNGKDIMNVSQQAAELVIRICNNIASPQGAIM